METQPGARTALVDPFGRELEEWLRDAPAFRTPYVSDLVVPPVTGPIARPEQAPVADDTVVDRAAPGDAPDGSAPREPSDAAPSFRRERHGRRAAACAPSFPEPPERLALRIGDLAVLVSATSGRSTIERIDLLEQELDQRDADLARLAAWEALVATNDDPEVRAARSFAHDVFADLLADAAAETDRRERRSAALTGPVPVAPAAVAPSTEGDRPSSVVSSAAVSSRAVSAAASPVAPAAAGPSPVAPVPASPVSARTRPTPLVQPATGPSAIQRAAFADAIRAHSGATAEVPTVLPAGIVEPTATTDPAATDSAATGTSTDGDRPGWWARLVARLLGVFGRRAAE